MSEIQRPKRPKKPNRSNEELLAELREQNRKARAKNGQRQHRRTKRQIEADKAAEEKRLNDIAEKRAKESIPDPLEKFEKTVVIKKSPYWEFGNCYKKGDKIFIKEGTPEYALSFTSSGKFIFRLTEREQFDRWGEIRYEVIDGIDNT